MPTYGTIPDTSTTRVATLTLNLAQVAAVYDAGTVANGPIMVLEAVVYVVVAGIGLISVSVQTNDTVPVELLSAAEGAVAGVLAGKNLKVFTTRTVIPSGKKIQYTIVGTGSAGTGLLYLHYKPLSSGATIS